MFCALIKFLLYFKNLKQRGCFSSLGDISGGGGKTAPGLTFLKYFKTLLVHKTCLYILGYIAYIFSRGVGASKANLSIKALINSKVKLIVVLSTLHESGLKFNLERHFNLQLKLVSDSCTDYFIFSVILALIHLSTQMKLHILQTIFISAITNVDFIPSFILEGNLNPSLHD